MPLFKPRRLEEIAVEVVKGKRVRIIEYPKGAAAPLLPLLNLEVVEGEAPPEGWMKPYVKAVRGTTVTFYGNLEGVILNGFAEIIATLANCDVLSGPQLRLYVYPGLPCYLSMLELAQFLKERGATAEIVNVSDEERLKLLTSKGVRSVPALEVEGRIIHVGLVTRKKLSEALGDL